MRQVKLRSLQIENFKGLRSFSIDFDESVTRIVGANGTGKTTIHDAYLWMLLGIDSANRSAFAVQPLDDSSKTIDHLTTSVAGVFDFDGISHEIKRSLHQTWTRRRGTKEDVLTGSESEYFIDNVPYKAGEFSKEIASLFCAQEDFKLVSSIAAFGQLDMKARRMKLIQMAGQMPELINHDDYPRLSEYYDKVRNVDSIKKQVKYEVDGLKQKQSEIPIKITENERNLPTGIDFDSIREQLAGKQAEIEAIDAKLQKASEGNAGLFSNLSSLNEELQKVSAELTEIESSLSAQRTKRVSEVNDALSVASAESRNAESKLNATHRDIEDIKRRIAEEQKRKDDIARQWRAKNAETFPDNIATECPTCHRPYDAEDVASARDEAIRSFNSAKTAALSALAATGNDVVARIAKLNEELDAKVSEEVVLIQKQAAAKEAENEARRKVADVPTLDFLKDNSREYQNVLAKRHEIRSKIANNTPEESEDERQLRNKKEALKREVSSLTMELAKEQNIAKVEARRRELEEEGAKIATAIAELDAVMYEIQQYNKAYIELVESRVSSMFKMVTWKMYQKNISNDGEMEICECLVDGVPVSTNVNTAGSVNAGIDIINALSSWLGISVPLWIDGKESVSNLIDTEAQLITLEVRENSPLTICETV